MKQVAAVAELADLAVLFRLPSAKWVIELAQ